ncbi:MAG: cohesin domain-containing protein [Methanoregula sp.]|jgi:hypothetical protein|nr:cohesin domain-containing protein [Methanoregula sp.]
MKNLTRIKNWNLIIIILLSGFLLISPVSAEGFELFINDQSAVAGTSVTIPVMITNAEDLAELSFEISYDPSVLKFSSADSGDISKNGIIESSETGPGKVLIDFVEDEGISQDGEIITLVFDVQGAGGSSSSIGIVPIKVLNLDSNDVPVDVRNGTIMVTSEGQKTPMSLGISLIALLVIVLIWTKGK